MEVSREVYTFAIPIWRSGRENMEDSLAQLVEHNTFNVGVSGSSPERVTKVKELSFDNIASLAQLVEHLTLNQGV